MARSTVTRRQAEEKAAATPAEGTTTGRARSRSSRVADKAKVGAGAGWGAYTKVKEGLKNKSFGEGEFKVEEEGTEYLIKFLQDEPFESYYQHWINNRAKGKKKSFTCPGEEACVLCDLEEYPRMLVLFNIAVFDEKSGEWTQKYWVCGKNASESIEDHANSKYNSPINKDGLYFTVKKSEANYGFTYSVTPILESQLQEGEALSAETLAGFNANLFDSSVVEAPKAEELEEVAKELV